jgi:hypothetical protein
MINTDAQAGPGCAPGIEHIYGLAVVFDVHSTECPISPAAMPQPAARR